MRAQALVLAEGTWISHWPPLTLIRKRCDTVSVLFDPRKNPARQALCGEATKTHKLMRLGFRPCYLRLIISPSPVNLVGISVSTSLLPHLHCHDSNQATTISATALRRSPGFRLPLYSPNPSMLLSKPFTSE